MYVCVCNAVTDRQIRRAFAEGARTLKELKTELGVAARCGTCKERAVDILRESRDRCGVLEPVVYQPTLA